MKKILPIAVLVIGIFSACGTGVIEYEVPEEIEVVEEEEPEVEATSNDRGITEEQICEDEWCWDCHYEYSNEEGKTYDIDTEIYCNTAMRRELSNDGHFLAYVDSPNIMIYNFDTEESDQLMSVYDDTDGVSFQWNESGNRLAMVVVNQENENYEFGTKLFILDLDDDGNLVKKNKYIYKIRYGCHDAGCNADDDDFYFLDDDTIIYRTWDTDDPYDPILEDDSYLKEIEL